jgi:Tfp pilus assembly protein PilO
MATRGITTWQIYAAGIAACAALVGGLWSAVVQPVVEQRQHIADLRQELNKRRQNSQSLTRALAADRVSLASLHENFEHSPLHLEPATRVNQRLAAINELATQAGLTFSDLHPGSAGDAPHYRMLPIHVAGTGTYPACAEFLHNLRNEFPDTGVATLDATAGAAQSANVTFQFDLVWYTQK